MKTICISINRKDTTHFWHFMIGELFPVIYKALQNKANRIEVCHPDRVWNKCKLDQFYDDISNNDMTFIKVNTPSKDVPVYLLDITDGWDEWIPNRATYSMIGNLETRTKVMTVVRYLKDKFDEYIIKHGRLINKKNYTIVQTRKDSQELSDYYKKAQTPCKKYGMSRRSIHETLEIVTDILENNKIPIVENLKDGEHFYRQLEPYIYAKGLVLGHGAGMFWMLFMDSGGNVLEFSPIGKEKDRNPNGVSETVGHNLVRHFYENKWQIDRIKCRKLLKRCNLI